MKRIFAAIKIHPQAALTNFISTLQHQLAMDTITWVNTENLHLTLKFFGETPDDKIQKIETELEKITFTPFDIEIGHLKIFGSRYQPRVLFLEAMNVSPLTLLSQQIKEKIATLGYEPDSQHFVPHLTLGRIKTISDKKYFQEKIGAYSEIVLQTEHVREFFLYESILYPSGPEYKIIKIFPKEI